MHAFLVINNVASASGCRFKIFDNGMHTDMMNEGLIRIVIYSGDQSIFSDHGKRARPKKWIVRYVIRITDRNVNGSCARTTYPLLCHVGSSLLYVFVASLAAPMTHGNLSRALPEGRVLRSYQHRLLQSSLPSSFFSLKT